MSVFYVQFAPCRCCGFLEWAQDVTADEAHISQDHPRPLPREGQQAAG